MDPLFISRFGWGVTGAAYATILSQGVAFLYGIIFVLRRNLAPFVFPFLPKKAEVKLILKLGIPSGLQMAVQEPAAVQFGSEFLMIVAFLYPFLGVNFVLNGIVRAAGAMYQVLILNVISFWLFRYPLTYLLSETIGEKGIAIGMGLSFVLSSIFAFLYYRFGKWKDKEIFRN